MSKKEQPSCSRLGAVGGQALIEGVMMKSKKTTAIAVRRMDNKRITVSRKDTKSVTEKYRFLKLPILRGVINFVETLILSFSTLTEATDMLGLEVAEEEQSKFDRWLEKHMGKWIVPVVSVISVILGLALAMTLFIWLPTFVCDLIFGAAGAEGASFATGAWRSVVEGVLKVVIFILYIWLTALIPDMKRVYMYHGAEHKSIFCYEKGLELTVENVKKQKRFHPRCGTSFMFFMILLSILIGICCLWWVETVWLRSVLKLLLLPITVGIGYEFIRFAGKHDNVFTRVMSKPGLWMQYITTKEPSDDIIEVGITSLKCALPDEFPGFFEEMQEQEEQYRAEQEAKKQGSEDAEAAKAEEGKDGVTDEPDGKEDPAS